MWVNLKNIYIVAIACRTTGHLHKINLHKKSNVFKSALYHYGWQKYFILGTNFFIFLRQDHLTHGPKLTDLLENRG